jgi:bacillithiol biosynthesis deacetylase BshB1
MNPTVKLDILAFGAHPDDVELSCSGLLMIEQRRGKKTGVVDLTEGELGSRGTVEHRRNEAAAAASIMELTTRENLGLSDGFFLNDIESQLKIIQIIRKYQPEIILCNAPSDRHPDHGKAAQLIADASFLSGLLKIETKYNQQEQTPWRPKYIFNYIQDKYLEPDFLVDISPVFEKKAAAIKAYQSQFYNPEFSGPETYISTPEFMENLFGRNKLFGKRIGVQYAEGFISAKKIGLSDLDSII